MSETKVYVKYQETCLNSHHSGEQYGDWYSHSSFNVTGVCLTKPDRWSDSSSEEFLLDQKINAGDVVFVLYMTYSSGDSFGHSTGNGDIIWVFTDALIANKVLKKFQDNQEEYSISFLTESGKEVTVSNSAAGYFERLENIQINAFLVNP